MVHHAPAGLRAPFLRDNAYLAVDFFFGLSGFVIAMSYENRLASTLKIKDFIAARILRLYPIYGFSTLLAAALIFVSRGLCHPRVLVHDMSLGLLFIPNLGGRSPELFPLDKAAWSLFWEMLVNIAYAVLVRFRAAQSRILVLTVAASLTVLGWWGTHSGTVDGGSMHSTFNLGFARVGYSFFAGVLICRLYKRQGLPRMGVRTSVLIAAVVCGVFTAILMTSFANSAAVQMITISLIFPALIYIGACVHIPTGTIPVASVLGEVSYPLYLLHLPLFGLLLGRRGAALIARYPHEHYLLFLLVAGCIITFAWMVAKYDIAVRKRLAALYYRLLDWFGSRLANLRSVSQTG